MNVSMKSRLAAEFLGTLWLVLGGCGSAVLAAKVLSTDPTPVNMGIGFVGVALAFGLSVMSAAYAFGHLSGGHFNPAVTLGLAVAKRVEWAAVMPYVVAQVLGGTLGAAILYVIAGGKPGFSATASGFAANGYGAHSPGGYSLMAALVCELVLSAIFLFIILGATDDRAPKGFAPIAIGLGLTLIHLVSIPVTNTSVNPARSLAVAWFAGGWALKQVWLFWLGPLAGAAFAGAVYRSLTDEDVDQHAPAQSRVNSARVKVERH